MIPDVVFNRSKLYDQALRRNPRFKTAPEETVFKKKIQSYKRVWSKEGSKILRELAKETKLKWHAPEIVCYITWGVVPYSDPLTLNIRGDAKDTRDTLTHELIHRMLSQRQNPERFHQNWRFLMKKYQKYPPKTKTHIVVHAIHEHILLKFYGEERLQHEIKRAKNPDYFLAWQIVKQDGYKNIITELTKGLK